MTLPRRFRSLLPIAIVVLATACRSEPVPHVLRAAQYRLMRVNGVSVRGESMSQPAPGSRLATLDCQDKVADGVLSVSPSGKAFQYRTRWRDCSGALLVTETNEGFIEAGNGRLTLRIEGGSAGGTFKGEYDDTSLTVYDLGGRLFFVKVLVK